jgi:hypothetical protein
MTEDVQGRQRKRGRLWLALAMLVVILAVFFVPPLVSLSRYKSRVTQLMSASLGRPVRLSSVELRLLPRPGLVLTNLTVQEDPAYGAEPVLHANTVVASLRLLSLWRGRIEISRISVDEASLNLVRTDQGRWNLDTLFRTAAAHAGAATAYGQPAGNGLVGGIARPAPLPYLEATNSRINFKSGTEKLPLSLVNTDLSFWQEEPGDWRIRLRGQPARTDVSLDLADTGVVRLEASVRRASELRQMPIHLDMEWREAQLGQLARLVIGSDPGWRGDLTGELHLDGTPDAAQIKTRLRATGVHRAEFAPAAPMDFDATCGFDYHFSSRSLEHLACDSPLGDGRVHFTGQMPGDGGLARFSAALDRIPLAAGLDALRTVRSDFGPGLEARGTITGTLTYSQRTAEQIAAEVRAMGTHGKANQSRAGAAKSLPAATGPLTGSLIIAGVQLSGGGLATPLQAPKMVLEPVAESSGHDEPPALSGSVAIAAGGASPLTLTSRLTLTGYQLDVRGQASFARARDLAHVAGLEDAKMLDSLAGDPVVVDLSAEGPWLPAQIVPFSSAPPAAAAASEVKRSHVGLPSTAEDKAEESAGPGPASAGPANPGSASAGEDSLVGTVTLHNANWKADFLATHVEIAKATLHLNHGGASWDPVDFSYGPVKGTASLSLPACVSPQPCAPQFTVQFGDLSASALQAAILGAHQETTMLSELIARFRPSTAPPWPVLQGTVKADSLVLGLVTLRNASATLHIDGTGAEMSSLTASLLGGSVNGTVTLSAGDKPVYTLEGQLEKLNPAAVGQLVGQRWSGGVFGGGGKIELSGFTDKDLAASAKGTLHFDWLHGSVGGAATQPNAHAARSALLPESVVVPAALVRFDRWTGDAEIANGTITLKKNQVMQGGRERAVEAAMKLADPPELSFAAPNATVARKR